MKNVKKLICMVLCLGLLLALCSCGADGKSEAANASRSLSEYGFENMDDYSVDGECILVYVNDYEGDEGYIICETDLGGHTMSLKDGYMTYVEDENIDGKFDFGAGPYECTVVDNNTLKIKSGYGEDLYIIEERIIPYGASTNVIFRMADGKLYVPATMIDWSKAYESATVMEEGIYGLYERDAVKLYLK